MGKEFWVVWVVENGVRQGGFQSVGGCYCEGGRARDRQARSLRGLAEREGAKTGHVKD